MKKPNKALRHNIYKEALILYKREISRHKLEPNWGLCFAITYTNSNSNPRYDAYHRMGTYFPEVYKHKSNYNNNYWFPITDTETRITILEQAIKETEPKPRTKKE